MVATMTTVNSITKILYTGTIQEQLQNEAVGWKRIESTSEGVTSEVGGQYVTFPIRIGRNNGIGFRNEMEALPAAGNQGFTSVRIGLKYGYGAVQLSGQTMKLADSNFQAFSSALSLEMNGLKEDVGKEQSRMFYGNTLGTIATVVTSASAGTITVDTLQYVQDGMFIDIVTTAGVSHAASRNILTITNSTNTITYDGSDVHTVVAAGDILVRQGSYGREPNGLASIDSSTGVLFNVDPATYRQWAATVNANGGTNRAISEGLMINLTDSVRQQGGKTSLILMSLGVRRAYFSLLSQQRRIVSTTEFTGGLTGIAFTNGRDIPCVEDVDAPANKMWFLQEDSFKIYRLADWDWLNMDGDIWKWLVGYDAWQAKLACYYELGVNRRNANGLLSDITEG
jgi:hypothetical protein